MRMPSISRAQAFLYRKRWLYSRRLVQVTILLSFLTLPGIGRIADGNLSSSTWFGVGLTDPYVMLQSWLAGGPMLLPAVAGALLVGAFYALFGGRIYCSWVCPINLVTDLAYWLRQKFNIKGNMTMSRELRAGVLLLSLVLCLITGTLAWESINPITLLQRELLWGSAAGATILMGLFLFDLLVSRRGWCGHLCPVGAFYAYLGRYGRLRVTATTAGSCAGCGSCIKVCPEPHVLAPVVSKNASAVTHGDCTRCGACLDQCTTGALNMTLDLKPGNLRGIPIVVEK